MVLRPYQEHAVSSILKEFEDHQSTLLVLPTGCGKTQCFVAVANKMNHARTLVLAHREELIFQAQDRFQRIGIGADIEMGDYRASTVFKRDVIISTVQSQIAGYNGAGRMTKFDPNEFGLVVIDEAHHAPASSYRKVLDHYKQNPNIKILGVTATPDRADEKAMGTVFETVAFDYEITDAIKEGYLVPIQQQFITIDSLDYSHVRTTAGDLNGADLAQVMEREENLQGIAGAVIQIIEDKKTLVFAASVAQAEQLSDIFNRHKEGMSDWISGFTPRDDRRGKLSEFSKGKLQVMVNCMVLTEGYDEVGIEVVVQGRPTKSRSLYSQMIGRGTRPLAGTIDDKNTNADRQIAIALSEKPSLLVLDFVGNSGKHKLISTADILGTEADEEVLELALKKAKASKEPTRMDQLVIEAQLEIDERKRKAALRKAKVVAKTTYTTTGVDPFDIFGIKPASSRGWHEGKQLTEKQVSLLRKQGIDPTKIPYAQAKQLIIELFRRWDNKLASLKQVTLLKKRGIDAVNMSYENASKAITEIAEREHWKKTA